MMALPAEATGVHTRLLKCTLEVETSRAYWALAGSEEQPTTRRAFEEYWFGVLSLGRVEVLMAKLLSPA